MEYQTKSPNLVAQKSRMATFEYDQDECQRKILTKIFTEPKKILSYGFRILKACNIYFALPQNFRSSPVTLHSEI